MAVIAVPSALKIRKATWRLDSPSQVNRSQWTGREQVEAEPWHTRWAAEVECAPLAGDDALAMRAFFGKLQGRANSFRLEAVDAAQTSITGIQINSPASAGGTTLNTVNWGGATGTVLRAGHLVTVNDQLNIIAADVTAASSVANISLVYPIRVAAASLTAVEVRWPTCLVALTDPSATWSVDLGSIYGFSLSVEERF